MKCFYHSADLDGHCSGAIVRHRFPECEMIGINYGDSFPWNIIQKEDTVYMVDFCLQPFGDMLRLADSCKSLILIDHHKSTQQEINNLSVEAFNRPGFTTFVDMDYAGCELTWKFLYELVYQGLPGESYPSMPKTVYYLGRYDIWKHEDNPDILAFQYGMRVYETDPSNEYSKAVWNDIFDDYPPALEKIIREGYLILKYIRSDNVKYATQTAFDINFQGHKTICINRAQCNSQLFDSVYDPEKHDIMMPFYRNKNGTWTVSLYTTHDHIDCSEIAKKMGGGGHKKAAGFQIDNLNKIGL